MSNFEGLPDHNSCARWRPSRPTGCEPVIFSRPFMTDANGNPLAISATQFPNKRFRCTGSPPSRNGYSSFIRRRGAPGESSKSFWFGPAHATHAQFAAKRARCRSASAG